VILAGEVFLHLTAEAPPDKEADRPKDKGEEDKYIRDD
jgi:hypothetical protein